MIIGIIERFLVGVFGENIGEGKSFADREGKSVNDYESCFFAPLFSFTAIIHFHAIRHLP